MSHNLPMFCKLQMCFIWLASTKWQMKFLQSVEFDWMHGLIHQLQKILKAFSLFLPFKPCRLSYHNCAWLYGSKWLFFIYCLLSVTQSEQKYDPLWSCDPQVEENCIKKHCSTVAFLILFISPLCSCCIPFVTKLTLGHLRVLVVGVDSFMLCKRSLGSNPAQVANYVEADFKGIEVNK